MLNTNIPEDYEYEKDLNYNTQNSNKYNSTNSYNSYYNKRKSYTGQYGFESSFYFASVLTLNCISLFLWFFLLSSFCAGEKECNCDCRCCNGACDCNNCNCNCNNGDAGKAALICIVFICLILIIYYSIKCCGKHIARYISIASMAFINFCILIVSLLVINNYNYHHIFPIMLVSGISIISNLLAIGLPNLKSCEILRYKDRIPSSEIINYNFNSNQNSQFNNNNAMANNNMNMQNNGQNPIDYPMYPKYSVPIVNNEVNNNGRNMSMNSNDTNSQIVDNINKDMGDAPLPAFEMQVKGK